MKRIPQGLALVSAAALAAFGCHALDVQTPDIVPPTSLNDPNALPTLRAGAIGDFEIAYDGSGAQGSSGTTEGQVAASGTIADEWVNTETFPDRVSADARTVDPSSATYATIFANLNRARVSTEHAATAFRSLSDTTQNAGLSEMMSLAGFTYVMLAENYCNGVPLDQLNADGTVTHGVQLTTSQILDTAQDRFTQALAAAQALNIAGANGAATKTKFVALATVGLARTLLDQGDAAGASAAASDALAPTAFSYVVEHDLNSFRQQNGVFNGNRNFKRYGVADLKGGVGFPYMSVPDPRTPFFRLPATNLGFDKKTPQFDQLRYVDQKASTTVATGTEARLINAEASLLAGDTAGFMGQLNTLRASPPAYFLVGNPPGPIPAGALAPLATPTSDTAAVSLLFAERARWLWFTAHRLNDLRRLVRPIGQRGGYGRAVNAVFPNGPYFKNGLTYGNDVNLPVPLTEQNNPNFVQCIDRNP
jgi:hypothetical protein